MDEDIEKQHVGMSERPDTANYTGELDNHTTKEIALNELTAKGRFLISILLNEHNVPGGTNSRGKRK